MPFDVVIHIHNVYELCKIIVYQVVLNEKGVRNLANCFKDCQLVDSF